MTKKQLTKQRIQNNRLNNLYKFECKQKSKLSAMQFSKVNIFENENNNLINKFKSII